MGDCRAGGGGDCAIKLFGKTIPVPENGGDGEKDTQYSDTTTESKGQDDKITVSDAQTDLPLPPDMDAPKPSSVDKDDASTKNSPTEEQSIADTSNSKEKLLKKPDKILPCPRCSSMDTKFCYYNNYNVNQPRHFCKNCQRYWTAGGAMRNVPVGAGRRKNKNSASSHFLQRIRAGTMDPICPAIKTNGTVLRFGSDTPPCEPVTFSPEKLIPMTRAENTDEQSIVSSVEGSNTKEEKNLINAKETCQGQGAANPLQYPCMNGGSVWPTPAYYASGIAIPFYPAAAAAAAAAATYWGCMVPGAWSIPWPPQSPQAVATSPNGVSLGSSESNSATLGKHSRDVAKKVNCNDIRAPKALRIDSPEDAAKSSIWTMIGIKKEKAGTDHTAKLAKIFEPKCDLSTHAMVKSSPLLHANPAALSRSVTFQEGS